MNLIVFSRLGLSCNIPLHYKEIVEWYCFVSSLSFLSTPPPPPPACVARTGPRSLIGRFNNPDVPFLGQKQGAALPCCYNSTHRGIYGKPINPQFTQFCGNMTERHISVHCVIIPSSSTGSLRLCDVLCNITLMFPSDWTICDSVYILTVNIYK